MKHDLNGKRILLIKQSSLGDIVHTVPVAHALKRCFPDCGIGWVVERGFAPLVEQDPAIDWVHPIHIPSTSNPDSPWSAYPAACSATWTVMTSLRAAFRARPYDWIIDLHASFRSGLLALMNPGGQRVGFSDARELNTLFQHQLVRVPAGPMHAVDKNLLFCEQFGCQAVAEDFHLATSPADEQAVATFLEDVGLHPSLPLAYVNPTARWQSKFWIDARWSELCDQLESAGVRTVFGGSAGDRGHLSTITARMRHPGVVAAGRLSLSQSVALIKKASMYLGVDTGPMHIAAMVGIPVVALFGPTHPERVGPYGVQSAVIQAEGLDCLCCRKRTCDQHSCMRGIEVAMVFERVMALRALTDRR